jgi:hypothetical protein
LVGFDCLFVSSCENEERLCLGTDDGSLQTAIDGWHSACDGEITFSPTTPVVTSLTATYNQDFCNTAGSACASGLDLTSQCSLSYTSLGAQFSSCICQPELLSLQYTCLYQVNTSCFGEPATLTNLPAYKLCDNAASVLGSAGPMNSVSRSETRWPLPCSFIFIASGSCFSVRI